MARHSIAALVTPALVLFIPSFALITTFRALVAAPVLPVATALIIATRPRIARRPYAATKCNCDQNQRQIPSTFHSTLLVERSDHWSHSLESRTAGSGRYGRVMGAFLKGWRYDPPEYETFGFCCGFGDKTLDCVFISSPCKGASGPMSKAPSRTPKYQALNELARRE